MRLIGLICFALGAPVKSAFAQEWWRKSLVPETIKEETPAKPLGHESNRVSLNEALKGRFQVITYRMPRDFDYEFSILVVDGKIKRAFVVSTSMPGKDPVLGVHRMEVPKVNGRPWPWKTSIKYQNSAMYWGLQISGGFFIHSSPHYGNLGKPASMGCIRVSLPDAMELFDTVVNQVRDAPSYSIVFEKTDLKANDDGARLLLSALADSGWTLDQLKNVLVYSRKEVTSVSTGDLEFSSGIPADAHVRAFAGQTQNLDAFPKCGDRSCWTAFRKDSTMIRLKPWIASLDPALTRFESSDTSAQFGPGQKISINDFLSGALSDLDPFYIHEVRVRLSGASAGAGVRVCDGSNGVCSKVRSVGANQSAELVFPMFQISERLKRSGSLDLEFTQGSGSLQSFMADFYENDSINSSAKQGGNGL